MVYTGYLEFGGREIVNGDRISQYVATMLPNLQIAPCANCEDLHTALGHKAYTTPLVDQPEWFDPDNPDTWDFYGLYPLSFEGFEDATTEATVTEYIYDGGAVSPPRRATRSMRVTGLLIGQSPAAVSAGMTWLRQALRPTACRDGGDCTGDHLCYMVACPPMCEDSPVLRQPRVVRDPTNRKPSRRYGPLKDVRMHDPYRRCEDGVVLSPLGQCTFSYERHLYHSTVVDGPKIIEEFDPACGAMVRVEFTVVAGVPSPFGTAVRIADGPTDASQVVTVQNMTCTPNAAGVTVRRYNLAYNPGMQDAGGWVASGSPFSVARTTAVVRREGGTSALSTLTTVSGDTISGVTQVGGYGSTAASLPAVAENMTYLVSAYGFSYVPAKLWIDVQPRNEANANVGPVISGIPITVRAQEWERPYVQLDTPVGATRLFITLRARTADGSNGVLGTQVAWADALVENDWGVPHSYFDGNFPSTGIVTDYLWAGQAGQSASRVVQFTYSGVVVDPGCAVVPNPPRPPAIVESCVEDPDVYTRYIATVPSDAVPLWSDTVPIIRIHSGNTALRQLRLRFYDNPFERSANLVDMCSFCGEFIVSYLPANSELLLDGIAQVATITDSRGVVMPAGHLLYGSGGGPMVWPHMTCGTQYEVMVDIVPDVTNVHIELCVAARE